MSEITITKILIRGKKAVGVEAYGMQYNSIHTAFKAAREKANPSIGYVRKEVVLVAGVIYSPKLLLLSGIGPAKDLQGINYSTCPRSHPGWKKSAGPSVCGTGDCSGPTGPSPNIIS